MVRTGVEFTRPAEFGDRYVWNPAADDIRLARACVDLKAGLHRAAGEVLAESRGEPALRAHRSLVLAAAAADSDAAEQWAAGDAGPDCLLLLARTAAVRALRAADRGDWRAAKLAEIAAADSERAAEAAPGDPVPLVVKLSLARLSTAPGAGSGSASAPASEPKSRRDPAAARSALRAAAWELFRQITELDPGNREAHHRLLALHFARYGGSAAEMWETAWSIADRVAPDSELALLPFVALAEDSRERLAGHSGERAAEHPRERPDWPDRWADPEWRRAAVAVYRSWFPRVAREYRYMPVVDLSCLGHALVMGRLIEARHVLGAMGPYATTAPWDLHRDPEAALTEVRRRLGLRVPVI